MVLGMGKGVLFREVSSVLLENGSTVKAKSADQ